LAAHREHATASLSSARKALATFQQDSAAATLRGYDPVNQNASLREAFSAIRKALAGGDIATAKTAMASVVKGVSAAQGPTVSSRLATDVNAIKSAVQTGDLKSASQALTAFGKDAGTLASTAVVDANLVASKQNGGAKIIPDVRSLQVALKSGDPKKVSSTFLKVEPELSSFSQTPQVFPTAAAGPYTLPPTATVTNSKQALIQGLQSLVDGGSQFAISSSTVLGSKGIASLAV
jgi:ribosomal protein S20